MFRTLYWRGGPGGYVLSGVAFAYVSKEFRGSKLHSIGCSFDFSIKRHDILRRTQNCHQAVPEPLHSDCISGAYRAGGY